MHPNRRGATPEGAGHELAFLDRHIPRQRGAGRLQRLQRPAHLTSTGTTALLSRHSVTVVIPTLNEAENIAWTLSRLPTGIDEVILVDGRSTDDTIDVARRARPDIRVIHEPRPGKGVALRTGFAAATGDFIVMIDADGSMHPSEILLYVAHLEIGYDFVKGSRFMLSGGSDDLTMIRRLGHWPLLTFVKRGYGVRITDLCYGFCAFRRSCLEDLALSSDGFEIETELVVRALGNRLRIAEVPSWELARLTGASNLKAFRDGRRILRILLRERFTSTRALVRAPKQLGPVLPGDGDTPRLIDLTDAGSVEERNAAAGRVS